MLKWWRKRSGRGDFSEPRLDRVSGLPRYRPFRTAYKIGCAARLGQLRQSGFSGLDPVAHKVDGLATVADKRARGRHGLRNI